jgi:hypothetical protein
MEIARIARLHPELFDDPVNFMSFCVHENLSRSDLNVLAQNLLYPQQIWAELLTLLQALVQLAERAPKVVRRSAHGGTIAKFVNVCPRNYNMGVFGRNVEWDWFAKSPCRLLYSTKEKARWPRIWGQLRYDELHRSFKRT